MLDSHEENGDDEIAAITMNLLYMKRRRKRGVPNFTYFPIVRIDVVESTGEVVQT